MARRRQPPEPPVDHDPYGLPEHLRPPCLVEDWIAGSEGPSPADLDGTCPPTVTEWAMVTARGRFLRARVAWAREHGLDHRDLTRAYGACGRPVFHDRAAFTAANTSAGRGGLAPYGTPPGRDSTRKDRPCPK